MGHINAVMKMPKTLEGGSLGMWSLVLQLLHVSVLSSNKGYITTKMYIYIYLHGKTGTNAGTYCSLWGATIQNMFVWGFFKFVWWRAIEQYFRP
jgi:hypothetical protein